jgi:predicted permease
MANNLRFSLRKLAKTPGFTATALATLALCLGANLTIYAVVDAILIRSLPFRDAGRLVTVFNSYPGAGVDRASASLPNYIDRKEAIKAFSSVAIDQEASTIVGASGAPNRVPTSRVSPEFFSTLGVNLAMGRSFTASELTYQTDGEAVITDGFWRSAFAADPAVLGRTFLCNGLSVTVVGVLPRDFRYLSSRAAFYRPAAFDPDEKGPTQRHSNNWEMVARLAPGATLADAQSQVDAFNLKQLRDDPYAQILKGTGYHTIVSPLQADHVHSVRPMLVLLQCGGVLLLLIGGVNLANLLLIRASGRTKELAVRQALGASPFHVAAEVLGETLLLALVGGGLGLLLGAAGIRLLGLLGTDHLPLGASVRFDARIGAAALVASLVTGVALSVPIIWFNVRSRLLPGLQIESRGGTTSRGAQRLRSAFIVAQVALAFVLLAGAGLLGVSLRRVLQTSPGFNPNGIMTGHISLPWKNYKDDASRLAFVRRLLPVIRALPGVSQVAVNDGVPFTGDGNDSAVAVEGFVPKPGESLRAHFLCNVTSDYWSIMGIPLLQGHLIDNWESQGNKNTCVVDRSFAQRYWPGASPMGHRLTDGPTFDEKNCATVVGVVGDVKHSELAENGGHGTIYFNFLGRPRGTFYLLVRTPLPAGSVAPMIQKAILGLDPDLPVDDLHPMLARIDDSLVARRSPAILAGIFSGVALLLAAIGTYGVLAYAVGQRRREIGIRMALGAQPREVLRLFLGLGATLLVFGLVLGVLGTWAASRAMQSVLFGVGSFDVGILAATAGIMAVSVFLAILLPSMRAASVNPTEALRND